MKPLRAGAARSALAEHLSQLMGTDPELTSNQIAAVLGGAIEESLDQIEQTSALGTLSPEYRKELRATFWRYFAHNSWALTRALRASNLLEKIK